MLFQLLCVASLLLAGLVWTYHAVLALVALIVRAPVRPSRDGAAAAHSFAILIPAHNEEAVIAGTLRSCAALNYPKNKYQTFVIADNCSDQTAAIATQMGAVCYRREDYTRKGKGHALAWALQIILPQKHDAVLILDADCQIDAHALQVFDRYLQDGEQVLQAQLVAANPDASATSYALAVGNYLENELFYVPKDRLGWAVLLRGTGMVFRRQVLDHHPFQPCSNVEDTEYSLHLLRAGLTIRYLQEVCVRSEYPVDREQLRVQRRRWTADNFRFSKARALHLIAESLCRRRPIVIDAVWTTFILIRSLVLLQLLLTAFLAVLSCAMVPGTLSNTLLATTAAIGLAHLVYVGLGVVRLGITRRRLALMQEIPAIVARLLLIFIKGVLGSAERDWGKTGRHTSPQPIPIKG